MGVSVPGTVETNYFLIVFDNLVRGKCLLVRCQLSELFAILILEVQLRHPKRIAGSSELLDLCEVHLKINQVFVRLFLCQEEWTRLPV